MVLLIWFNFFRCDLACWTIGISRYIVNQKEKIIKYITLDTGIKGAMVLFENGKPVEALGFKRQGQGIDIHHAAAKLYQWHTDLIYIEAITARPGQGAKATFTQGLVVGQCDALAKLYCKTIEHIYPQTWTSFTKRLSTSPGNPSKVIAQELTGTHFFEFAAQHKSKRGHKKYHDGIADCLCISIYIERDSYIDLLP